MPDVQPPVPKPLEWIASAWQDLCEFPLPVRREMGHALYQAQIGRKHDAAKPLTGSEFKGANVTEIVEDDASGTYRAVYTVQFEGIVYVLHAFQKKSKRGISTPKKEIDLVISRIKLARQHYGSQKPARHGC